MALGGRSLSVLAAEHGLPVALVAPFGQGTCLDLGLELSH